MYDQTTRAIRVSAKPFYLDSESSPEKGRYFWAYTIAIENRGRETVQLVDAGRSAKPDSREGFFCNQIGLHDQLRAVCFLGEVTACDKQEAENREE